MVHRYRSSLVRSLRGALWSDRPPRFSVLVLCLLLSPSPRAGAQPGTQADLDLGGRLMRETARDYREQSRYPNDSWPLKAGQADPVKDERTPTPVSTRADGLELSVWPATVGFEAPEPVDLFAALSSGERRLVVQQVAGEVVGSSGEVVGKFEYTDDGQAPDEKAGDGTYSARLDWVPAPELAEIYLVRVEARTAEGKQLRASGGFLYGRPWAHLTGQYRDSVRDGSVVVAAEVEVTRAGRFHLTGTLYSSGKQPLGVAQQAAHLEPGRHWLELTFFGLMFHDRGAAGPYTLGSTVLTTVSALPGAPSRLAQDVHVTKPYPLSSLRSTPFERADLVGAAERLEAAADGAEAIVKPSATADQGPGTPTAVTATTEPCLIFVHGKNDDSTYDNWNEAREYWQSWFWGTDFIATATNYFARSYYVVGYDGAVPWSAERAAGKVATEIIHASQGGSDPGGNRCAKTFAQGGTFWVIAHSMGGPLMDFILGNDDDTDPYYNYTGRFDLVSQKLSGVISLSGAHRGSELADAACTLGHSCSAAALALGFQCDDVTRWLRTDDSHQVRANASAPARTVYLTGGYESYLTGPAYCLTGEDDGAVQYASIYACSGSGTAYYDNSNVCSNGQKQESSGFRNLDAGREDHTTIHNDSDRDARRAIPDGFWTCGGVPCQPDTLVDTAMSAAQLVNYIFSNPCVYTLHPVAQGFSASGGGATVTLQATAGCSGNWSAATNDPSWLSIASVNGSTVSYNVAPNAGTGSRTGTLTIAGETFTVTQDGGSATCSYSISPAAPTVGAGGGPGTVSVTAGSGCPWTAVSNASEWLTVTSGSPGTGNGTVGYNVAANGSASPRVGTMTIGGKTFTLTQNGASQGNDYPYATASCSGADVWNFVTRQCTSFVAWRMNRDTGVTTLNLSENSYPFSNHMGGRLSQANRLSDAGGWATKLQALGYAVDASPRVGDIAHWTASEAPPVGHVAYVSAVNPDGSVDIEEYNWGTSCGYGIRHLTGASRPPRYIHFEGSRLIVRPNSEDVYYLQNGRAYHVTEYTLAAAMEAADAPGWVWQGRRRVDQAEWAQYAAGPEFLTADYRSDGLLLQQIGPDPVYRMAGGERRWVRSPEVVINCLGGFPNVIHVPSSVLSSYVPSIGDDMPLADSSDSFSGSGGSGTVGVEPGGTCSWTAVSNDPGWLTVTSGQNGSGTDQVTFSVASNQSSSPRTGTLTIAGQEFTVNQAGQSCSYTLQPTFKSFPASGGTDFVTVTTSAGCSWTAVSSQPSWLAVPLGNNQTGSGTIYYSVAANTNSASRNAKLTIGGKIFNVSQAGQSCTYSIGPDQSVGGAAGNGVVAVTTTSGCSWSASSNSPTWLTVTSGASGSSNGTVGFAFSTNPGGSLRVGTLTVAGLTFTLTQAGSGVSNDETSGATLVSVLPANLVQDTTAATGNASDPAHSCRANSRDSRTVWFRYVASFTGTLRVSTAGSDYDTVLTAYPGATSPGAELACNDDVGGGSLQSEMGFAVSSGQSYLIEVSGWGASSPGGRLELSVAPAGYAFHDPGLGAPRCRTVGNVCDSGAWLTGRASLGPEPHQPNTLDSCEDGLEGAFHSDESNDRIKVVALDGTDFAAGKGVRVEATVWAYSSYSADRLDLYYAADASNPSWTLIQTLAPGAAGGQTLSATYNLPAGPVQAVRARFRYQGTPAACGTGTYDDHDDLVFAVSTLPAVTTGPAVAIGTTSATLTASVNPNGVETTTQFEYGPTSGYGNAVSAQTVTGVTAQAISAQISGLTCGTPYHFKAKASNAGGTASGADVVFSTSACPALSGTVTDSGTGLPLTDVQVHVYDAAGQFVGYGQSNASGAYVLSTGLPTGTYYARTTNWAGYLDELYNNLACTAGVCNVTSGTPIGVTAGTTRTGVDFSLARGGRISGTVTNSSTAAPLANVKVDIATASGNWVAYGYTDTSGNYLTATGLNPGTYFARTSNQSGYLDELYDNLPCPNGACTVTSGTPISVSAGTTAPGINFGLVQGGRISGVVTDTATGAPLESVRVIVNVAGGAYVTATYTNSSGVYTVSSLVAGTYYVHTSNELGYVDEMFANVPCPGGSCTTDSGAPVVVTAGGTTSGVNLGLDRGARVAGAVSDATTGQGLAGVTVYVYNPSGWYMGYGVTGSNGAYTTRSGLPTGTYYARTEAAAGHIDELWDNIPCPGGVCSPPSGTPLNLTAGVTRAGVDFSLWSAGAITGTVTSSATGLPIAGVEVDIYDSSGVWKAYGWTNSSGAYATDTPLPPGTYYLTTWNGQGYLDELYNNLPCLGSSCPVTGGTPVIVGAGTVAGINFALAPGGRVGGTLADGTTGQPLAYQEVKIFDGTGAQVRSVFTNGSGAYLTASGLTPGTYYARTANTLGYTDELYDNLPCPNGACAVTSGTSINLAAGATVSAVDFGLQAGGRISGTITDASTGLPLANIGVYVFPPSGDYVASAYTDSSGAYTVTGLATGTYFARSWDWGDYVDELYDNVPCPGWTCGLSGGAPVGVTVGQTTAGIDFGLARGGRVGGTVTDATSGQPLASVDVYVYDAGGNYVTRGTTGSLGTFTTPGLVAGTYHVRTSNNQGYVDELYDDVSCPAGACTVTGGTPVAVATGLVTDAVDFELTPGARIQGTVTDALLGTPLPGVQVYVYDALGNWITYVSSDSSGGYLTGTGLAPGDYYARTYRASGYFDELFDDIPCPIGACAVTSGTPVSVTAGATRGDVDFALSPGGRVSGTVTDAATGQPLAGVEVNIYSSASAYVTSGTTDASGAYVSSAGLASGTYYARTSNSLGYIEELYDNVSCPAGACSPTSGAPIAVTAGTTTAGIAFALSRGGRVTGTVSDATTGLPLAGAWVDVYSATGAFVAWGSTDGAGVYVTGTGLPPGTYFARTGNSLGFLDELYDDIPCVAGACNVTSGTPIAVSAGGVTAGVDLALARGARIQGAITDAGTGQPVSNVYVDIYNSVGTYVTYGVTGTSGGYTTADVVAPGTYFARTWNSRGFVDELWDDISCAASACGVTTGTPIALAAGGVTTGIDFALVRGGQVQGTVTQSANGTPLSNVTVSILNASGALVTTRTTGSTGAWSVTSNLPPGTYYARTSNSLGYVDELYDGITCPGGGCAATNGTPIVVTAGASLSDVDFALAGGGQFQGTVTDAATGQPLASVSVWVFDATGWLLASRTTNSSGAYSINGLPSGAYYVMTVNSQGYVDELYDNIPCPGGACGGVTGGTPVPVTAGATTTGIDFVLGRGGSVSGSVTDAATGQPLAGLTVRIYNASGGLVTSRTTQSVGSYATATGLPAGTYFARTSNTQGYLDEVYDDLPCPSWACSVTSGTPITVVAGASTTGVDFALALAGSIGGTVTDAASGAPIAGVSVRIYDAAGAQVTSRTTGSTGSYLTTTSLPAGTYFARTSNSQGYVDELFDNRPCTGGACTVTAGTPITVTAGATSSASFALGSGGRVAGLVTDAATGAPLAGATVRIYDQAGAQLASGTTDAAGIYTSGSGLLAGAHFARATARGYLDQVFDGLPCPNGVCSPTGGTAIPVSLGATTPGVDFALAQAAPQTNDEIPGATAISSWPYHGSEDTRSATTNPSDPIHSCATGTQDSNSVWFRFVASFNGTAWVSTVNSNFDTVLTAYPGTTGVGPELACNDDSNGGQQSEIRFPVRAGQSYLIEVTTYGTPSGGTLHLSLAPAFVKGDLNGDGLPDLVFRSLVDGAHNKVWFMDGVARSAEADITPDAPGADWKIRGVDDFSGDGRNDLLFWNELTGNVEVWLMNGTTRSGAPIPLSGAPVLNPQWDLSATADFNGDRQPDIVWRNFTSQKIVIWTMNGAAKVGSIIPTPDLAVNGNWIVVAALDYNNDGSTDFLWYNYTSGKIVTWYMNASVVRTLGQFTTPANAGDANWKVVASSDYSHDHVPGTPPLGLPDIVWRNETSGNQVVWHLNDASTRVHGEFTSPASNAPALDWTVVGPR